MILTKLIMKKNCNNLKKIKLSYLHLNFHRIYYLNMDSINNQ